jgi:hypothetical protein
MYRGLVYSTPCLVCKAIKHLGVKETFIPCGRYFMFSSVWSYKYLPHIVTTESIETGSNAVLKNTRIYIERWAFWEIVRHVEHGRLLYRGILNSRNVNIQKCKQNWRREVTQ